MKREIIVHTLILNNHGEVLIIQRSKNDDILPGYWDIPGGTLEKGEDPAVGAIREVKEETGLPVSDVTLFFQKSNIDFKKNTQFITLVFYATTLHSSVALNFEDHEAYQWVRSSEVGTFKVVDYLLDCVNSFEKLKHSSGVKVAPETLLTKQSN